MGRVGGVGDGLKGACPVTDLARVGGLYAELCCPWKWFLPKILPLSLSSSCHSPDPSGPLLAGHPQVLGPSSLLESACLESGFSCLYQSPRPKFSL